MEPLISVVIPTYNREKTIIRCLKSVMNQSYKNIEIIVVDDCSVDNTQAVVESISDNRIRFIKLEKNSGACVARNVGVENSKGEYIAFQDSDDEWLPDKLKKQLNSLQKENADIVFCQMRRIDEENNKKIDIYPADSQSHFIKKEELLPGNLISTQTMIGKKQCFADEPFDPQMLRFQDWELALRIVQKYKIYFCSDILVDTYLQVDSISKSNKKTIQGLSQILKNNIKDYKQYPKIYNDLLSWLSRVMVITEQNPKIVYREMCKTKFTFKIGIKYILALMGKF